MNVTCAQITSLAQHQLKSELSYDAATDRRSSSSNLVPSHSTSFNLNRLHLNLSAISSMAILVALNVLLEQANFTVSIRVADPTSYHTICVCTEALSARSHWYLLHKKKYDMIKIRLSHVYLCNESIRHACSCVSFLSMHRSGFDHVRRGPSTEKRLSCHRNAEVCTKTQALVLCCHAFLHGLPQIRLHNHLKAA